METHLRLDVISSERLSLIAIKLWKYVFVCFMHRSRSVNSAFDRKVSNNKGQEGCVNKRTREETEKRTIK